MAESRRGPDLETVAAPQTHYINWAEIFGIPDPCGYYKGFIRIVVIYINYLQCSANYNKKQVLCSATVRYAKAVNNLFKLRSFSPPADLSDLNNMTAILHHNMLQEEDTTSQGNVLCLTTKNLPSYVEWPQPANARIQSVTSFWTSWLLVATSGLT
jgi:hypothetical protein